MCCVSLEMLYYNISALSFFFLHSQFTLGGIRIQKHRLTLTQAMLALVSTETPHV